MCEMIYDTKILSEMYIYNLCQDCVGFIYPKNDLQKLNANHSSEMIHIYSFLY